MNPSPEANAVLIIPALDEEAAIGATLERVPRGLFRQIIVADNGSRDLTAQIAAQAGATVVTEPRRGYGAACLKAIAAVPPDTRILVFMDADSSDNPAEARQLLEPILGGRADLVLGSRVLGRAEPGSLQPHQVLGNRLATFLVRLLYRYRYTDLGPFRAIRAEAFHRLQMRDRNYGWTVEMQIRAVQQGLRIVEVPVSYRRRIGVSKVSGNWRASLLAGAKILWTVFRLVLTRPSN